MKKNHTGITLIALVITIIILLILAGITIGMLTGENGILTKATQASEKYKIETAREKILLSITNYEIDKENTTLYEELRKIEGLSYISPNGEDKNEGPPYTVIVDGYEFIVQYKEGTEALEVIYKGGATEKKEAPEIKTEYDKEKVENLTITITATTKDEEGLKQIIVNKKRVEGETVKYDVITEENVTGKEKTINVVIPANGEYVIQVIGQNDMVTQEEIIVDNIVNATIVATVSAGEVVDNHVVLTVRGKNTEIPIQLMELYVDGQKVKTYECEEETMEKEETYTITNMEFYKDISCYVKVFNTKGKEATSATITTVNNKTIATLTDLKKLASQVNTGNTFGGKSIYLIQDITTGENWEPIGYADATANWAGRYFAGIFEGNNHNINITSLSKSGTYKSSGLFGMIIGGSINNLTISGKLDATCSHIGGIVGVIKDGTIMNCINNSNVNSEIDKNHGGIAGQASNTRIENCKNTNQIYGKSQVGGICGNAQNSTVISNCQNSGTVECCGSETVPYGTNTADLGAVGGIVGYPNNATIDRCSNSGNVVGNNSTNPVKGVAGGGIVGWGIDTTITKSKNTGQVYYYIASGIANNNGDGGGLGGIIGGAVNCTVRESFNTNLISSKHQNGNCVMNHIGGIVGYGLKVKIYNVYNTGSISGKDSVGGIIGIYVSNRQGVVGISEIYNCYNASANVIGEAQVGTFIGATNGEGGTKGSYIGLLKDIKQIGEQYTTNSWTNASTYTLEQMKTTGSRIINIAK